MWARDGAYDDGKTMEGLVLITFAETRMENTSASGGCLRVFPLLHLISLKSCRSTAGLVNVYDGSDAFSSSTTIHPKPLKTLQHLTTSISTLRFNHDSQLLAVASKVTKDQLRLVSTAFSGFSQVF